MREPRHFPAQPSGPFFVLYASLVSFTAYFAMYAFRKPFAAAMYEAESLFGIEPKTAFVIAQIIGYTLSKYWGVRLLSQLPRERLRRALMISVLAAWASLVLFALLPAPGKVVALFFNGLPLGLVWGLVVRYLEGRRRSEVLLAGLSASFILASGVVKDIGRWLLREGVSEDWMPAAVGALFIPVYLLSVYMLDRLPAPDHRDVALRVRRAPMNRKERGAFLSQLPIAFTLLFSIYFFLTAYRDFRDNYGVELFGELGIADAPAIFTRTELPVAVIVLLVLSTLSAIADRRKGVIAVFLVMSSGILLLTIATLSRQAGVIGPVAWMVLTGLGSYLAYVPFGSVLFERIVAITGKAGTAVFAIYIADALGYTGSIALQLSRDIWVSEQSRLYFFDQLSIFMGVGGAILMVVALLDVLRSQKAKSP